METPLTLPRAPLAHGNPNVSDGSKGMRSTATKAGSATSASRQAAKIHARRRQEQQLQYFLPTPPPSTPSPYLLPASILSSRSRTHSTRATPAPTSAATLEQQTVFGLGGLPTPQTTYVPHTQKEANILAPQVVSPTLAGETPRPRLLRSISTYFSPAASIYSYLTTPSTVSSSASSSFAELDTPATSIAPSPRDSAFDFRKQAYSLEQQVQTEVEVLPVSDIIEGEDEEIVEMAPPPFPFSASRSTNTFAIRRPKSIVVRKSTGASLVEGRRESPRVGFEVEEPEEEEESILVSPRSSRRSSRLRSATPVAPSSSLRSSHTTSPRLQTPTTSLRAARATRTKPASPTAKPKSIKSSKTIIPPCYLHSDRHASDSLAESSDVVPCDWIRSRNPHRFNNYSKSDAQCATPICSACVAHETYGAKSIWSLTVPSHLKARFPSAPERAAEINRQRSRIRYFCKSCILPGETVVIPEYLKEEGVQKVEGPAERCTCTLRNPIKLFEELDMDQDGNFVEMGKQGRTDMYFQCKGCAESSWFEYAARFGGIDGVIMMVKKRKRVDWKRGGVVVRPRGRVAIRRWTCCGCGKGVAGVKPKKRDLEAEEGEWMRGMEKVCGGQGWCTWCHYPVWEGGEEDGMADVRRIVEMRKEELKEDWVREKTAREAVRGLGLRGIRNDDTTWMDVDEEDGWNDVPAETVRYKTADEDTTMMDAYDSGIEI